MKIIDSVRERTDSVRKSKGSVRKSKEKTRRGSSKTAMTRSSKWIKINKGLKAGGDLGATG